MSFPKSGRTWVKSFLANYYAEYLGIPLFYDFAPIWRRAGRRKVPRMIFDHGMHRAEPDYCRQRYLSRVQGKKIILLSRDPRKVIFSYYFRLVKRMSLLQSSEMTMSQFIRNDVYGIRSIVRYLNDWSTASDSCKAFFMLRYEDCVERPETAFAALLDFLCVPIDPECFDIALGRSVDTTRKIEESGCRRDDELLADISRGPQYFETDVNGDNCVRRYAGDDKAYINALTKSDIDFMENEMLKLDPVFNY